MNDLRDAVLKLAAAVELLATDTATGDVTPAWRAQDAFILAQEARDIANTIAGPA